MKTMKHVGICDLWITVAYYKNSEIALNEKNTKKSNQQILYLFIQGGKRTWEVKVASLLARTPTALSEA